MVDVENGVALDEVTVEESGDYLLTANYTGEKRVNIDLNVAPIESVHYSDSNLGKLDELLHTDWIPDLQISKYSEGGGTFNYLYVSATGVSITMIYDNQTYTSFPVNLPEDFGSISNPKDVVLQFEKENNSKSVTFTDVFFTYVPEIARLWLL